MERFIGVLIEHYAGAFPVWLAPVQAMLIPIADRHVDYARQTAAKLKEAGLRVEVDERGERMNAKIRDAQMQKIPYMLVVGDKEAESGGVALRLRSGREPRPDVGRGVPQTRAHEDVAGSALSRRRPACTCVSALRPRSEGDRYGLPSKRPVMPRGGLRRPTPGPGRGGEDAAIGRGKRRVSVTIRPSGDRAQMRASSERCVG